MNSLKTATSAPAHSPRQPMTSISINSPTHQLPTVPLLQQTRRHFERPIRVWPFAMDSLPENNENENESANEGAHLVGEPPKSSDSTQQAVTQQPTVQKVKKPKQATVGRHAKEQQVKKGGDGQPTGCIPLPYFGIKHYLHNFYGVTPETSREAKMWRQFELNEDDYIAILAAGQGTSDEECWHCHKRCFAWSITLGTLILITGITCLMLGFITPRQPVLIGQVEENDLKSWIASHGNTANLDGAPRAALNILDHKAVEHNNTLDILKVGGMMSTCLGVLFLVTALIFPPSSGDPSTWANEANIPHMNQVSEAFKNCFRSISCKKNNKASGLVASTDEKIPVLEQVKSVQPQP